MKTAISLTALCALVIALAGCSGGGGSSYGSISRNLTPDLRGLAERPVDMDSHIAYANDTDWRTFWEDLGRTFYTDHPSRLSPFPIVYTSGMPR
jgi:hypothetical protein